MFNLRDRRALLIGAGGGIGQATARAFGDLGAEVLLMDKAAPSELAGELSAAGIAARALSADVSSTGALESALAGIGIIDILVYLAGISPWDDWSTPEFENRFDEVIAVNLRGAAMAARALMPGMIERRSGRIVLVGSLAGKTGGLIAGAHYAASKGGLHALVKWLAQRGAPYNVLVNGVAPASTATPMMTGRSVDLDRIPLRRMSRPEEIAGPIAFLCSPAASYVCGTVLDVNGGVYMA
jgi:3-oxoacyl-[acyl-carrier protein] reductase